MHNLKVGNYILLGGHTEDFSPGGASQVALRGCSEEVSEEPGYTGAFTETEQNTTR